MSNLEQYYNEEFKDCPSFSTLFDSEKEGIKNTLGFNLWQANKQFKELRLVIAKEIQSIMDIIATIKITY